MNGNKKEFDIRDLGEGFTRDFFMSYDWPVFLDMVCEARGIARGAKLTADEFNALSYAAGITPQMCHFDWGKFIEYAQNVRDYFVFRGCSFKKLEECEMPGMNESFMKALTALYIDLKYAVKSLTFEKRFTENELRLEVVTFVARLIEKKYVFV